MRSTWRSCWPNGARWLAATPAAQAARKRRAARPTSTAMAPSASLACSRCSPTGGRVHRDVQPRRLRNRGRSTPATSRASGGSSTTTICWMRSCCWARCWAWSGRTGKWCAVCQLWQVVGLPPPTASKLISKRPAALELATCDSGEELRVPPWVSSSVLGEECAVSPVTEAGTCVLEIFCRERLAKPTRSYRMDDRAVYPVRHQTSP